jgi:hypothetical protein
MTKNPTERNFFILNSRIKFTRTPTSLNHHLLQFVANACLKLELFVTLLKDNIIQFICKYWGLFHDINGVAVERSGHVQC